MCNNFKLEYSIFYYINEPNCSLSKYSILARGSKIGAVHIKRDKVHWKYYVIRSRIYLKKKITRSHSLNIKKNNIHHKQIPFKNVGNCVSIVKNPQPLTNWNNTIAQQGKDRRNENHGCLMFCGNKELLGLINNEREILFIIK